ncbi:nuclear transport factor 2 family protein [Olleya sp. YS]|uniref:nuclear transport factor 2 family protein n=1 Tax=Olleya sp. YS TaxID=3028318 RepID=UPI00243423C6|nr:nuclear transport factor 2 family protein [Olleya sp. YS]WGD35658.1 nuclear transport factor 2 family protein [Olleya sp. YS]
MKYLKVCVIFIVVLFSCEKKEEKLDITTIKNNINTSLDDWHKAASNADFKAYFNLMTKDGVFLGTDATENWQLEDFKSFSKPYFDKGKAWSFTALERNIYVYHDQKIAWFDELLDTQMEICRGSGVIKKVDGDWKVKHYVLSIAIPNDNVKEVVSLKKKNDSILKSKMLKH